MAGFSKIYLIGGLGGYQGADGINPIQMQIWVGDADRQWFEPHYMDPSIKPLGSIRFLVPEGPNHPAALLDACIAFFPEPFAQCPSLAKVAAMLSGVTQLDFHLGRKDIPSLWTQLRKEAWPYFEHLRIFEAALRPVVASKECST
jgi:hypothetical protein